MHHNYMYLFMFQYIKILWKRYDDTIAHPCYITGINFLNNNFYFSISMYKEKV